MREIEVKMIDESGRNLEQLGGLVKDFMTRVYKNFDSYERVSPDYYWNNQYSQRCDFVRVRSMGDGMGQITMKHKDTDTNVDRVEIDLPHLTELNVALEFFERTFDKKPVKVTKKYFTYVADDVALCAYQIVGDSKVIFEVECKDEKTVNAIIGWFNNYLYMMGEPNDLKIVDSSIYEMFVLNQEPNFVD